MRPNTLVYINVESLSLLFLIYLLHAYDMIFNVHVFVCVTIFWFFTHSKIMSFRVSVMSHTFNKIVFK